MNDRYTDALSYLRLTFLTVPCYVVGYTYVLLLDLVAMKCKPRAVSHCCHVYVSVDQLASSLIPSLTSVTTASSRIGDSEYSDVTCQISVVPVVQ